jgi:hypothetical protein
MVPALAKGTTLHLILVQYRGPKMVNCELVGERPLGLAVPARKGRNPGLH